MIISLTNPGDVNLILRLKRGALKKREAFNFFKIYIDDTVVYNMLMLYT